jgi:acylaminoacyl-peptidase
MNFVTSPSQVRLKELLTKGCYTFTSSIIEPSPKGVTVQLKYSIPDLSDYSKRSFVQSSVVTDLDLSSAIVPFDDRVKGSVVDSSTGLILRACEGGSGTSGSDKNAVFLEIWKGNEELIRVVVPDCKDIHFNDNFGSPIFFTGGECVAFIGEKSDSKYPRGFWAENKDNVNPADKFRFAPDYGETMSKTKTPTLMLFNHVNNEWKTIDVPGYHLAFPTAIPGDDTLLVVGYKRDSKLHIPGYSVCFNRESCLFRIDNVWSGENRKIQKLTGDMYLALAPAISECGSVAVFAGHDAYFSSHLTELDLYMLDLRKSNSSPVRVNIDKHRDDESLIPTFNGLYFLTQAEAGMIRHLPSSSGQRHIILPSYSSGKGGIFVIDLDTGKVLQSIFPPLDKADASFSSVSLLQVRGNDIVFNHHGYTSPRTVWLASVDPEDHSKVIKFVKLFASPLNKDEWFNNCELSVIHTANCPAWLLRSRRSDDSPIRRPLIAYLHGGPHGMAIAGFTVEIANYVAAGYDVVIPNYRGSLSFGKEFLSSLIGQAGIVDVNDCHDCVLEAKRLLNPSTIILVGGSHGGFLTAWLLGHPEKKVEYSAGVLWNPASDIVSMVLTSDIPEWSLSQVLTESECERESPIAPSEPFFAKAYKQSPISVVQNVSVPVMVLLGTADRRVVPCAGLRWAQAVESNGISVDLLSFPDQGHAIAGPEYNETAIVAKCAWVDDHIARTMKKDI